MNEVQELAIRFSPFGWLDLRTACEIGDEIQLSEYEIFEIIDDERLSC